MTEPEEVVRLVKRGYRLQVSEQLLNETSMLSFLLGEQRKGHAAMEDIPDGERADMEIARRRLLEAVEDGIAEGWIEDGYEGIAILDVPKTRRSGWVWDETEEEFAARTADKPPQTIFPVRHRRK